MFGYVRPYADELTVREYRQYKGIYCGLCKVLGQEYGALIRLTLSYDCTLLALLGVGYAPVCPDFPEKRCVVNPLKRCRFCMESENAALRYAAAVSVLLTRFKLEDDRMDEGFFKRAAAKLLFAFIKKPYKKAKLAFPAAEETVRTQMERQMTVERQNAGLDACADPTAQMLSQLLQALSKDPAQQRILEQLGYFLGRWIYLMDAADDLEDDKKRGKFNPFLTYLGFSAEKTALTAEEKTVARDRCNAVLNATAAQVTLASQLLDLHTFAPLAKNILQQGLGEMQREILYLQLRPNRKRKMPAA